MTQYGKTIEEVTFEYENLSDEELEVAFKKAFEEVSEDGGSAAEGEPVAEDGDGESAEPVAEEGEPEGDPAPEEKYELSHDDIRSALYNLLDAISEDGYSYAWIAEVYDNKFIYCDYTENKFYRQGYTRDGDNVSLEDNKVEVFSEWLSKEEKDALDALKADYAVLKAFKDNYDANEIKSQKDAIFTKEEYECLAENAEFKALIADAEKFSVEEIETKVKAIFADHVISTGTFSVKTEETKKTKTLALNFNKKETKKSPYGNLFNKD